MPKGERDGGCGLQQVSAPAPRIFSETANSLSLSFSVQASPGSLACHMSFVPPSA